MTGGCLARRACPVGAEQAHGPRAGGLHDARLPAREGGAGYGDGLTRRDDPDRGPERDAVADHPGRERGANIGGRGGADRCALAVQYPARRADRQRALHGRIEPPADRDVEIEVVRRDDDVGIARFAQDAPNARFVGESEGSGFLGTDLRQGRRVLARLRAMA